MTKGENIDLLLIIGNSFMILLIRPTWYLIRLYAGREPKWPRQPRHKRFFLNLLFDLLSPAHPDMFDTTRKKKKEEEEACSSLPVAMATLLYLRAPTRMPDCRKLGTVYFCFLQEPRAKPRKRTTEGQDGNVLTVFCRSFRTGCIR